MISLYQHIILTLGGNKMDMVLFDCNGTLLNDSHMIYGFYRYAVDRWGEKPPVSITEFFQDTHDAGDYMAPYRQAGITIPREDLNDSYKRYYNERINKVDMFPYVPDTLRAIRNRGLKIGLVTLQSRVLVEPFFADFDILHFFDNSRFESFNKAEDLKSILSDEGVSPDDALYVGDMPSDAEDAMSAGLDHLLFFNGYVPQSALLSVSRADRIIDSIRDVLKFLP